MSFSLKPPLGTPLNPHHFLSHGLIGCWLMNERGGVRVYNMGSEKRVGTITNGTWSPEGLTFNGANSKVDTGGIIYSSTRNSLTTIVKFRPTAITVNYGFLGVRTAANTGFFYGFMGEVAGDPFRLTKFGVADVNSGASGVSAGQWVTGAVTCNASAICFYKDGKLLTQAAGNALNPGDLNIFLGGYNNQSYLTSPFNGCISSIFLYDRVLSAFEIASHYANPYQMFEPTFPLWMGAEIISVNATLDTLVITEYAANVSIVASYLLYVWQRTI